MKKLLVIGSVFTAFSAVSLFANDSVTYTNGHQQAIIKNQANVLDTVPKKDHDTTKRKTDTTVVKLQELR